jgi:hypothetical protein
MQELTCELNGIKYLLVECMATKNNKKRLDEKIEKYDCIFQGVSKIQEEGFFYFCLCNSKSFSA